ACWIIGCNATRPVRPLFARECRRAGVSAIRPGDQEMEPPMTSQSFILRMALQFLLRFIRLEGRTNSDQPQLLRMRATFPDYFDLHIKVAACISKRARGDSNTRPTD